jgi:alkylresorcinol/alkylpyrone synthase
MSAVRIGGIGTAVPKNICDQSSVRAVVEKMFGERVENLDRLLRVFDHLHIEQRHFVREPDWYGKEHGLGAANDIFIEAALALSVEAAREALARSEGCADDFAGIVVANTTGVMTPSLDAYLVQELGLPMTVARVPLFGLGCAGGVSGLGRAAELSRSRKGAPVLFVAVEICSTTFQRNDLSKSNLIGTSIFADGAAALVVGCDESGPEVVGSYHRLFPQTYDIMGWDIVDSGMKVRFSRDIPAFVKARIPEVIADACSAWKITIDEIGTFIAHPGGAKVLDAFAEAIGRSADVLEASREILRKHGNMSSATILFVLERLMTHNLFEPGYGLMSALGPGFSSDQLLLYQS